MTFDPTRLNASKTKTHDIIMNKSKVTAVKNKSKRAGFPVLESMQQTASRLGCSLDLIKSAKRAGSVAFQAHGRVNTAILIPELFALLTAQAAGGGNEYLDAQQEQARLNKSKRAAQERENAEAEKLLIRRETAEEVLWEQGVQPIRAGLIAFHRTTFRHVDRELDRAQVSQTVRDGVQTILVEAYDKILADIRNGFPKQTAKVEAVESMRDTTAR